MYSKLWKGGFTQQVPITRYAFMEGEPSDITQFYCTDDDGNGEWKDGLEVRIE